MGDCPLLLTYPVHTLPFAFSSLHHHHNYHHHHHRHPSPTRENSSKMPIPRCRRAGLISVLLPSPPPGPVRWPTALPRSGPGPPSATSPSPLTAPFSSTAPRKAQNQLYAPYVSPRSPSRRRSRSPISIPNLFRCPDREPSAASATQPAWPPTSPSRPPHARPSSPSGPPPGAPPAAPSSPSSPTSSSPASARPRAASPSPRSRSMLPT